MQKYVVQAPCRSDVLTAALYRAYGEKLPQEPTLDDLIHVLNRVEFPKH